jgi:uncharacterized protein
MCKNMLEYEISPYLIQHKDNPVHWLPWGEKALEKARRSNKPILLSIGYAACHWCHVMAHESFEDPDTAEVMNRLFINIKVDREERPDIDKIYMNAIHLMGEQGGWPLTMFLTPLGEPFWGGTYFPKNAQYGRPGFIQVLTQMAEIHQNQPDKIKANTDAIKHHLNNKQAQNTDQVLTENIANQIATRLLQQIDFIDGGLKGAPKFPQTIILDYLWRAGTRLALPEYHDAVTISLTQMSQGGIYDHLGGGFSRYSVDARWRAPHFEKMLYDNALILDLLITVFQATSSPLFKLRIEETIAWIQREMITKDGAFSASLDADSEGVEGKFYVWSAQEIKKVLKNDYEDFAKIYDISEGGNWEQTNILNRLASKHLGNTEQELKLAKNRKALLNLRNKRIRPGLDDKVLSDWNGLMIASLAGAAVTFKNPLWLEMAQKACDFITHTMIIDGRLHHAARADKIHHPATSDGYANMIRANLTLHQATNEEIYLDTAIELNSTLYKHYWDSADGGYFFTADFAESLIVRTRSASDDATPNANGIMAQNLIKLFLLTANQEHLDRADQIFSAFTAELLQNIFGFASMLVAFEMRRELLSVVLASGEDERNSQTIIETIRAFMPATAVLLITNSSTQPDKNHPAFGKSALNNRPTVYICRNNTCANPLTGEDEIIQALKAL